MEKKMTDKHKFMAYVLSTDADLNKKKNITQHQIAELFGVSQSSVAQGIKEAKLRLRIDALEKELSKYKKEIINLKNVDLLDLPEDFDWEYKRKL